MNTNLGLNVEQILEELLNPSRLWLRSEILARPNPVPTASGFYAWYFDDVPARVPASDCVVRDGSVLLYIGIAPESAWSKENVRTRLRYHMRGNAFGSTLRRSLGCLLAEQLGIELRSTGANRRTTFGSGESILCDWLGQHARVTWYTCPEPWLREPDVIRSVSLPLNLEHNERHPFHAALSDLRSNAKERAMTLPILGPDP